MREFCCCNRSQVATHNSTLEAKHNDFYRVTKYAVLRRLYRDYELEKVRIEALLLHGSTNLLQNYSEEVDRHMTSLKIAFKEIASTQSNDIVAKPIGETMAILDTLDQQGKLEHCVMSGDLHSYDILMNERFAKLYEIRKILDKQLAT